MKFYYIYCTAFILNGQIKHSTNFFTSMISRGKAIDVPTLELRVIILLTDQPKKILPTAHTKKIKNEKQNELTLPNFN